MQFLFERGLSQEHLRFVELSHLEHRGEHIMWFDEPFADWKPATRLPGFLPTDFTDGRAHWYHVHETNTWYALEQPSERRPLFAESHVACFTRVQGTETRYVFWQGRLDADADEYYLFDEATSGDSPAPRAAFAHV